MRLLPTGSELPEEKLSLSTVRPGFGKQLHVEVEVADAENGLESAVHIHLLHIGAGVWH
jgi:hypothetical protein